PSATAKYIRISLKPFGGIQVTVPKRTSMKQAMAFVETKTDWIRRAQTRITAHENRQTIFTPETVFSTQSRKIQLFPWKSTQFRAQLSKDALKIFYPHETDIRSEQTQEIIRDYIIRTLRKEAGDYLPQRTEQLAAKHGFTYRGVTVKNVSSRWGSCSAVNHINLNIHLVRLPQHLSDYVILHELVHTVHKNHGDRFWQSLDTVTGGKAKQLAAEMKQYQADCF
ncbi:MAG: M48 family metallopeptidase, partial [Bacteroidales bacterium]|nr:M48 family metallopeptidase [Bacteroidales bacterium]